MVDGAMDWSRYMEGLQGKINTDLSNMNEAGKEYFKVLSSIDWANAKEFEPPANGESITIPRDGFVSFVCRASGNAPYFELLQFLDKTVNQTIANGFNNGYYFTSFAAFKKDIPIKVTYSDVSYKMLRYFPIGGN